MIFSAVVIIIISRIRIKEKYHTLANKVTAYDLIRYARHNVKKKSPDIKSKGCFDKGMKKLNYQRRILNKVYEKGHVKGGSYEEEKKKIDSIIKKYRNFRL